MNVLYCICESSSTNRFKVAIPVSYKEKYNFYGIFKFYYIEINCLTEGEIIFNNIISGKNVYLIECIPQTLIPALRNKTFITGYKYKLLYLKAGIAVSEDVESIIEGCKMVSERVENVIEGCRMVSGKVENIIEKYETVSGRAESVIEKYETVSGRVESVIERCGVVPERRENIIERCGVVPEKVESVMKRCGIIPVNVENVIKPCKEASCSREFINNSY